MKKCTTFAVSMEKFFYIVATIAEIPVMGLTVAKRLSELKNQLLRVSTIKRFCVLMVW